MVLYFAKLTTSTQSTNNYQALLHVATVKPQFCELVFGIYLTNSVSQMYCMMLTFICN